MIVTKERTVRENRWRKIPKDFWDWVENYTYRRAFRTGMCFDLNLAEIADLHQELMIDVAKRWRWYKRSKSPAKAFVAMTVTHRLADFANNKVRQVRDLEDETTSLDIPLFYDNGFSNVPCDRGELVTDDEYGLRRQIRRRSAQEEAELQMDVRRLVAKLPPDLRTICEYVMKYGVLNAAERLNYAESTFRKKLAALRNHFDEIKEYVVPVGTSENTDRRRPPWEQTQE